MFAGNFAPRGWAFCDGQHATIAQYPALYQAIGTTYGGDGATTFQLPDFRGRVPVHRGRGFQIGDAGGSELADITSENMPGHSHTGSVASGVQPVATGTRVTIVADPRPVTTFATDGYAGASGGNNAHENMQPFLSLHFIIALGDEGASDEPFIGEVRMFAGRNVPAGWMRCDGQVLDVEANQELFAAVGTTYGGDGTTTFAIPDLRTRVALHAGSGEGLTMRQLGESGGSSEASLNATQLPFHTHRITTASEGGTLLVTADGGSGWGAASDDPSLAEATHNNMQPYQVLNYLIATRGVSPA